MEPAFSSVVFLELNAQCLKVYEPNYFSEK